MNKVILIGNLVRDPELRHTQQGKAVANFTVAINEYNDHVEFVDCVAWENLAQNLSTYCTKGSKVAVEGRIRKRQYQAKDGSNRYTTEIVANNIEFLNTRQNQVDNDQGGYQPQTEPQGNWEPGGGVVDISEDDLPF